MTETRQSLRLLPDLDEDTGLVDAIAQAPAIIAAASLLFEAVLPNLGYVDDRGYSWSRLPRGSQLHRLPEAQSLFGSVWGMVLTPADGYYPRPPRFEDMWLTPPGLWVDMWGWLESYVPYPLGAAMRDIVDYDRYKGYPVSSGEWPSHPEPSEPPPGATAPLLEGDDMRHDAVTRWQQARFNARRSVSGSQRASKPWAGLRDAMYPLAAALYGRVQTILNADIQLVQDLADEYGEAAAPSSKPGLKLKPRPSYRGVSY